MTVDNDQNNDSDAPESDDFPEKDIIREKETSSERIHETSDSLRIYLRQIGNIPLLTPERQTDAAMQIDEATRNYRRELYKLGFVTVEHLRILAGHSAQTLNITEQFLPSSIKCKNGSYNQFMGEIPQWEKDIAAHYKKLHSACLNKSPQLESIRSETVNIISRYEVVCDHIEEWYKVALEYISLANPAITNVFKASEADIPEDKKEYLEEKFLMPLAQFFIQLKNIEKAREKLINLRQVMLEGNLRLAISIAHKYRNKGMPLSDLIQEGNLGLMRALEKFDFRLGHRFSTYATWWIKQTISRALAEQSRIIRIPVHMINTINAMNNSEQLFIQEHGREPSIEELAATLEIPTSRISAIRKMARQTISLQSPIGDSENNSVLEDILSDNESEDPASGIARKVVKEKLHELLATPPEREQQIIIMRFGLMGYSPMTLVDVSKHFNLTRERIRQLEIQTIEKLGSPSKLKFFDGFFHTK